VGRDPNTTPANAEITTHFLEWSLNHQKTKQISKVPFLISSFPSSAFSSVGTQISPLFSVMYKKIKECLRRIFCEWKMGGG
jgi:hypothetical protein